VFQTRIAVVERDAAIERFADLNFRASEAETARLWRDLQPPSVPLHDVVVADDAFVREAADAFEMFRSRAPGLGCLAREVSEAAVVVGEETAQDAIGRIEIAGAGQAEFAAEAILQHAPETLDASLGLRALGGQEGDAELIECAAELGGLALSGEFFFDRPVVVVADEDATAISVEGDGNAQATEQTLEEAEISLGGLGGEELGGENFTGGIILHAESREMRTATFEPVVRGAIQLHQFSCAP
jgi:hypothetical protein